MVVEGLQNEQAIKKGARVDRPNTFQWLSQSHKDEVLTYFWESSVRENVRTYQRFVQTDPLYRDLGVVISSITSPRFTKANEFGYNFLNS